MMIQNIQLTADNGISVVVREEMDEHFSDVTVYISPEDAAPIIQSMLDIAGNLL